MKEYRQEPGGRRVKGNDLEVIQAVALLGEQFFSQYGNFILSGCVVNGNAISSGIVMLNGKACLFDGISAAILPFYVKYVVDTENVAYETGTGTGIGYEIFKAAPATVGESGAFRLDNAPRFADKFQPVNAANADTVDGKHASDFLERHNGNMVQGSSIGVVPLVDGGNAVGMYCRKADNSSLAGIGGLFTNGILQNLFIGWGDQPHSSGNNLSVSEAAITYKNQKIWHAGNDGAASGLDADTVDSYHARDFVRNISPNNILQQRWDSNLGAIVHRVDDVDGVPVHKALNADMVDGKHAADFASFAAVSLPPGEIPTNLPHIASVHVPGVEYSVIITVADYGGAPLQLRLRGYVGTEDIFFRTPVSNQWRRVVIVEPNGDIIAFKS